MIAILTLKESIKENYIKYEAYALPVMKFLCSLITLIIINSTLGYMEQMNSIFIVIIGALICSFMPKNFIIFVASIFTLLHIYELTIEGALVVFAVFVMIYVLYLRFATEDIIVILILPLLFVCKIPYVIPLILGLIGTPISILSVGSGTVVYFLLERISKNEAIIEGMATEDALLRIQYILDGILKNKEMFVVLIAFSLTIVVINTIKKMNIDYAWTIAIVVGGVVNIVIIFTGDLIVGTDISILATIIGMIFSLVIAKIFQIFSFNLDYSRSEKVRFEDDEYYYFVKAIPKISLSKPEKTVKRINRSSKTQPSQKNISTHSLRG